MLKEGAKHYSGLDEAVFRNITACRQFTQITRSSLGPNGMNKMVVNHLEKLFVTNDAATIIKELEVKYERIIEMKDFELALLDQALNKQTNKNSK